MRTLLLLLSGSLCHFSDHHHPFIPLAHPIHPIIPLIRPAPLLMFHHPLPRAHFFLKRRHMLIFPQIKSYKCDEDEKKAEIQRKILGSAATEVSSANSTANVTAPVKSVEVVPKEAAPMTLLKASLTENFPEKEQKTAQIEPEKPKTAPVEIASHSLTPVQSTEKIVQNPNDFAKMAGKIEAKVNDNEAADETKGEIVGDVMMNENGQQVGELPTEKGNISQKQANVSQGTISSK